MSESKQNYILPLSIVFAAVIIAAGLVLAFSGALDKESSANKAPERISIEDAAKEVSLNKKDILACVESEITAPRVDRDLASAETVGVKGTPTSIVIGPNGQTITIPGAQPLAKWNQIVDMAKTGELFEQRLETDLSENITPVTTEDHIRGNENATVTIIEYSDIDCPFCKRLHDELKRLIAQRDDVRWVYRHFPITSLQGHANTYRKSLATECALNLTGDEDIFYSYLDTLIEG